MLSPNEKLDFVLKSFVKNGHDWEWAGFTHEQLFNRVKSEMQNVHEFAEIIEKLKTDKLIVLKEFTGSYVEWRYVLTFHGRWFIGYVEQAARNERESNRLKSLERFQKANARQMTCLTIWIAVATVVVGIQGLLAIIDWFSTHYWCK